jgi:hypothetical protein
MPLPPINFSVFTAIRIYAARSGKMQEIFRNENREMQRNQAKCRELKRMGDIF